MSASFTTESLPYSRIGDCPKGGSRANPCYPGASYFLPSPSPPWDKSGVDIPYVQSVIDLPSWCAQPIGQLDRQ